MENSSTALTVRKSKKSKKPKRILQSLLILGAIVYCAVMLINQQVALSRANDVIVEYNEKILAEAEIRARLQSELKQVDTDEYLIQKTREKLGLVRTNERVFIDVSKMDKN